ncbi:MAG: hypothetical protein ACLU30_15970 [Odoribacter splanchnicus]
MFYYRKRVNGEWGQQLCHEWRFFDESGYSAFITGYPVRTKDWTWNLSVNWSGNINEVVPEPWIRILMLII